MKKSIATKPFYAVLRWLYVQIVARLTFIFTAIFEIVSIALNQVITGDDALERISIWFDTYLSSLPQLHYCDANQCLS